MSYLFRKTVWAVGQGGFSMGTLYEASTPQRRLYTYVYDCGSNQLTDLRREIESAQLHFDIDEVRKIDTLFISHLDSDHVNGIDMLCQSFDFRIDRVVLPYLDYETRYYLAAKAMVDGSATGLYLDFVVNPVKWVKSRVPDAAIELLGPSPEEGDNGRPPEAPREPNPNQPSRPPSHKGDARTQPSIERGPGRRTHYARLLQHHWLSIGPSGTGLKDFPLLLLAHVPPRSASRLAAFRSALNAAGFGKLSARALREVLADGARREVLRTCFLKLASDHNIISMHLLVKSTNAAQLDKSNNHWQGNHYWQALHDRVGFLFSGDASLNTGIYFRHWQRFYGHHLQDVRVFSLPHHGSELSFQIQLLNQLPNANFIAQAGVNGYDHPGPCVVQQIRGAGRQFHQVGNDTSHRVDLHYKIA